MMVRTRFAPSPTGTIHIGGLRTALYAYALAKHNNGEFILRIEDTDKKRQVEGSQEKIQEILTQFNLKWDGEIFVQSERLEIYKSAAEKLVEDGNAYLDDGAIRIKIPKNIKVGYNDFVLGKYVEWDTTTLEDLVLLKSDGFPTYHLASVVDDHAMDITHVLRGHDWLPSTPIHLLIYKFLNFDKPEIGHLTDILDPEGGKLSKRKGSTSVEGLMGEGYLPDAILNFVMLLGWAPKDNKEIFTLDEFVEAFDPKGLQKANPIFNREKLDWFNGQYIRKLSDDEFVKIAKPFAGELTNALLKEITPLIKDRIKKLTDIESYTIFFIKEPEVNSSLLGQSDHLQKAYEVLENLKDWTKENLDEVLMKAIKDNNFKTGEFFMDLRIAITGQKFTPPINESIVILGKDKTLNRIKKLI